MFTIEYQLYLPNLILIVIDVELLFQLQSSQRKESVYYVI